MHRCPRSHCAADVTAESAICAPAYCDPRCCVVLTGVIQDRHRSWRGCNDRRARRSAAGLAGTCASKTRLPRHPARVPVANPRRLRVRIVRNLVIVTAQARLQSGTDCSRRGCKSEWPSRPGPRRDRAEQIRAPAFEGRSRCGCRSRWRSTRTCRCGFRSSTDRWSDETCRNVVKKSPSLVPFETRAWDDVENPVVRSP